MKKIHGTGEYCPECSWGVVPQVWEGLRRFGEWVRRLLAHNKNTLVMGGCTLNSCVRVSAIDTMEFFKGDGLRVVVDLNDRVRYFIYRC